MAMAQSPPPDAIIAVVPPMPRVALPFSNASAKPLIVRLRNWVGDVVLGVPTLRLLEANGYQLHLVGKRWAQDLLKGEGWTVEPLASGWGARTRQMHRLRMRCRALDAGFDHRLNALTLPYSFSSALDMRLAGLNAVGVAHEGRRWLLARAMQRSNELHELEAYLCLAKPFLPPSAQSAAAPESIGLQVAPEHHRAAQALCLAHRLSPGQFIMLCPFAGGTFEKQPKTWPDFAALAKQLVQQGKTLVLCPGPGEVAQAQEHFSDCLILPEVNLGLYAALLKLAGLMVSNDTGPGHLSAAVGTKTLSVLGPTDPLQWRAWGPQVVWVKGLGNGWPAMDAVIEQVHVMSAVNHKADHA
jgi:heptosyltransferase II